ncbi:MAG: hypothetical protein WAU78_16505 [Roseiarcus sp.]
MFGWFKKKPSELSPEMTALADELFRPQVLALTITQVVSDYANAAKAGRVEYPAHRRSSTNVEAVWNDVRIEALHKMFGFGMADLMMLADLRRQADLFAAFLDERPHLEFPQPRGESVADTLQAVWQTYLYLDAVGSEVMDSATDHTTLEGKGRDILSDFTAEAGELRDLWVTYRRAITDDAESLPKMPLTMIDLLWADVTRKTKSIAISKVFGPDQEAGFQFLLQTVAQHGIAKDVEKTQAKIARLRAAREPEDIRDATT